MQWRATAIAIWLGTVPYLFGCAAPTSPAPATAEAQPDLSGVWLGKPVQSLSPSDPGAKKTLGSEGDIPYTPWAIERMKATRPATGPDATLKDTNDPSLRYADPNGYPRASIHPLRFNLVQTPNAIYQLWEYNQSWRQIVLNKPHSTDPDITWFGESVGKWEGDTLVVDVVGLRDVTWLDPIGHPHSEDLRITERIRRVDPETLVFDLTFDDPIAYTKPWTSHLTFTLVKDGAMTENIDTISDELRFRQRFLGETPGILVRK
jgi:hypothetical protein